jgi:hypothetical protein
MTGRTVTIRPGIQDEIANRLLEIKKQRDRKAAARAWEQALQKPMKFKAEDLGIRSLSVSSNDVPLKNIDQCMSRVQRQMIQIRIRDARVHISRR